METLGKLLSLFVLSALLAGCATGGDSNKKDNFTSGSAEADRRAERVMPGDKRKGASKDKDGQSAPENRTLYDRLGGEAGITAIVDDFLKRALEDPRVNWSRQGVREGSWFRTKKVEAWQPTPENVAKLKKNFVQFISLAAGGPTKYQGRPMKESHASLAITKAEFEAALGDLKATLDRLGIAPDVQKELVAIIESTRPQIVAGGRS